MVRSWWIVFFVALCINVRFLIHEDSTVEVIDGQVVRAGVSVT